MGIKCAVQGIKCAVQVLTLTRLLLHFTESKRVCFVYSYSLPLASARILPRPSSHCCVSTCPPSLFSAYTALSRHYLLPLLRHSQTPITRQGVCLPTMCMRMSMHMSMIKCMFQPSGICVQVSVCVCALFANMSVLCAHVRVCMCACMCALDTACLHLHVCTHVGCLLTAQQRLGLRALVCGACSPCSGSSVDGGRRWRRPCLCTRP